MHKLSGCKEPYKIGCHAPRIDTHKMGYPQWTYPLKELLLVPMGLIYLKFFTYMPKLLSEEFVLTLVYFGLQDFVMLF